MSKLPADWSESTLKEVVSDMHQGINTVTEKIKYFDSGIDILQAKHITAGYIDLSDPKKVSLEDYDKYKDKYQPKLNHILLTNIGTIGKVLLVKENLSFLIAWNIFLIKCNESKVVPNYLLNILKKLDSDKFYDKYLTGNATKFINKKFMGDIKLPLPPLEEQKKIADILSTVDQKIAFVEESISQTEELKKGLMQKLLTEGIGHIEFKDSEIDRIPESWKVDTFEKLKIEVIDGDRGKNYPKQNEFLDSGYCLFLSAKNVTKRGFEFTEKQFINEEKDSLLRKGKLQREDLVLTTRGTVGNIAYFSAEIPFENMRINSGMVLLRTQTLNTDYLYKLMNSYIIQNHISNIAFGSAQPQLTVKEIKKFRIPVPPLEEQKQIAEILSTVDKKLEVLKDKKESFEELKKGLMQKLLTGEVRV